MSIRKTMAKGSIGSVLFCVTAVAALTISSASARAQTPPRPPAAGSVEIYDPQTGTQVQAPPFPYSYPPGYQPPAEAPTAQPSPDDQPPPDDQAALEQQQAEQEAQREAEQQAQEAQAQQAEQGAYYDDGVQVIGAAQPDLGPDQAIAESYDDGYDPGAYAQFETALDPYGSWVNDSTYGNVWIPSAAVVGADFVPYYSGGHWVLTEFGWTWVSNWDWGWAPFHYGRWAMLGGRGWGWIPGTMWGPAWVSWRSGGGYVGWAPLPPRGAAIPASFGARAGWHFAPVGQLGGARLACVPPRAVPGLFARTSIVANDRVLTRGDMTVRVNAGPLRGINTQPVRLASTVPRVLPRLAVLPHPGQPVAARPWARLASIDAGSARATTGVRAPAFQPRASASTYQAQPRPAAALGYQPPAYRPAAPAYHAPGYGYQAPAYHAPAYRAPAYHAPAYQASMPAYHAPSYGAPVYQRPAPAYHAPAYSPPTYNAPAYHAPAYQAPVFRASAPAFSPAPSFAPSHMGGSQFGSAGGGHFGGGFGGGRRR
jgi:hypothetical protein